MFKDKYAKKAREITQEYIESFGAQFGNIDDLDAAIASALQEVSEYGVMIHRLDENGMWALQCRSDAWFAIWDLCEELGMDTDNEDSGLQTVLDFIKSLKSKI